MIDIIIPYYNAEKTIRRALASIAMQTVDEDMTVTIVDDCSEDPRELHSIAHEFTNMLDIDILHMPENGGPGKARQTGLDNTDGRLVMFMDADDTFSTSYAVMKLKKAIEAQNADIAVARFWEETEKGLVEHKGDHVWVFAKMYRRELIDRFLVEFPPSRANEDVAFNTVLCKLTDRIVYLQDIVYEWHFRPDSITRKDNASYGFGEGHTGFIDSMIWSVNELRERNINKEIIRRLAVEVLCKLYFFHESLTANAPQNSEASRKKLHEYYDAAIKPIVLEGALPFAYIAEIYREVQKTMFCGDGLESVTISKMTFREYLAKLGYYTDYKSTLEG